KQRLESIWKFIDGSFAVGDDFVYLRDNSVVPNGLNYAQLARRYPELKLRFDSYPLPIVVVETNDEDLIDDMFSRLNEAVPLNAPEKRNAFGGPMQAAIRDVAKHSFFINRLPFSNNRYRHFDMAAKMLLVESIQTVTDTKKVYLD